MAIRSIHCKLGVVDDVGNIITISPKTTSNDIYIRENRFGKGTTLQELIDNLGEIAYDKNFNGINDKNTANANITWSANKISKEFYDVSVINSRKVNEFKNKCDIVIDSISAHGVEASKTDPLTVLCSKIRTIKDNYYLAGYEEGGGGEDPDPTPTPDPDPTPVIVYNFTNAYAEVDITFDSMIVGDDKVYNGTIVVPLPEEVSGSNVEIIAAGINDLYFSAVSTFTDFETESDARIIVDSLSITYPDIDQYENYDEFSFGIDVSLKARGSNEGGEFIPKLQGSFNIIYQVAITE